MSRITRHAGTAAVLAGLAAASAASARADFDVTLGNGDKVVGTHSPAGEVERFRFHVPAGAVITVSVKPKPPHTMDVRVSGPTGEILVEGVTGPRRYAGIEADQTGEYMVELTGGFATEGDYKMSVRWTNPPPRTVEGNQGDGETQFVHAVEIGGRATVTAVATSGSPAHPRVARWLLDDVPVGSFDPGRPDATRHTVTTGPAAETAEYQFGIVDAQGGGGPIAVTFRTKPPRASKRKIDLTTGTLGDGDNDEVTSELVGPGGGFVGIDDGLSPLDGAGVSVPPGALPFPSPILIGSSVTLVPPNPNQQGAGPTIFFGPEGQQFAQPVLVTIPFDPQALVGDPAKLQIFTRDGEGNVSLVPPPYEIDVFAGTVTFPALHFSSFRAFARSTSPGDLTGDGFDDLVVYAGDTLGSDNTSPGLLVFPGGPDVRGKLDVPMDDAAAVVAVPADRDDPPGGVIRAGFAVGDHDGDGDADLVAINSPGEGPPGFLRIYRGGKKFLKDVKRGRFVRIEADGYGFEAVAAGDMDGDGRAEVFASDTGGGPVAGGIVWVLAGVAQPSNGSVAGAPSRATAMSGASFGSRMVCGDFDGDGYADLAASGTGFAANFVEVYAGGIAFVIRFPTQAPLRLTGMATAGGAFGLELAAGDVDGDGRAELAVGAPFDGFVFLRDGGPLGSSEFLSAAIRTGQGNFGASMALLSLPADASGYDPSALFIGAPLRDFGGGTAVGALSTVRRNVAGLWDETASRLGASGTDGQLGHVYPPIDWDGDGIQDVAIGTPGFDSPDIIDGTDAGRVEVFFGPDFAVATAVRITGRGAASLGSR